MAPSSLDTNREVAVAQVQGRSFPEHLYYDLDNQVWYEALGDGTVRAGFTPLAIELAGDVLVFTPRRIGQQFDAQRSFATVECGKWVGAARAAFAGVVVASNTTLEQRPKLLNEDAFGTGWMLIVRPSEPDWHAALVTGPAIEAAFASWIAAEAYKDRAG
jgi:glycine cleavage system H protein